MRAPGCSLASAIASAATTARRRSAPSLTGTAYDCFEQRARAGGWSLYAGFQGRLIRQQLFIEGRSDTSTSEVRKKPFVLDTLIGADWSPFDRWQVGLVMVSRTREFHGQRRVDYFSGLQIIRLIE